MGVSKYELSSAGKRSNDAVLPTRSIYTIESPMNNSATDIKSNSQNGHSRDCSSDGQNGQDGQKNARNDKALDGFSGSDSNACPVNKDMSKEQERYIKQAELGVGCWRPRRLQCLAKSLWTFVLLYSPCALCLVTFNYYIRTQVTSVERNFRINSSKMGLLMSFNDFGSLIFVLIGSHFGKYFHIPRLLSASVFIMALCIMSLALTQAITPTYLPKGVNSDQTNSTTDSGSAEQSSFLCQNLNHSHVDPNATTESGQSADRDTATVDIHWGFYLTSVVTFVIGAMMSYRVSLPTYYIEKNVKDKSNSGLILGVLITAMVFGSPISLLLGGAMNDLPVDMGDSEMDLYDPRWISAWWLGFLIIGACALVTSIPVFCLPRHIIHDQNGGSDMCCVRKKSTPDEDSDVVKANGSASKQGKFHSLNDRDWMTTGSGGETRAKTRLWDQIKDWPRSLKRVLLYPAVPLILIEWFLTIGGISGSMAFQLKYIENQFDMEASSVSYYLGYAQIAASFLGTFLGGFLITRLKLTTAGMYKLCWVGQFIAICGSMSFIAMGCPNHNIQGFNTFHSNLSISSCSCSSDDVLFVCGSDGINYLSPCVAGCKQTDGLNFADCQLLDGESGTVKPGFCDKECSLFIPFIIVYNVLVFAATLTLTPRILMMARTVKAEDQPLVTGLNELMSTAGALLGPIGFGEVYDKTCVLWPVQGGACHLSDKDELRFTFLGTEAILRGCGMFLLTIATIIMHVQQKRKALSDTSSVTVEVFKDGARTLSSPARNDSVDDGRSHKKTSQDSGLSTASSNDNGDGQCGKGDGGEGYDNRGFES